MRVKRFYLIFLAALLTVIMGCSPNDAPTQTPTTNTPVPLVTPKTTPNLTTEETAWNKVVEAAKKEGKLTIYSFNLVGDVGIAVGRAFQDAYGISTDIITGRGAEFTERVKTEKRMGRLVADLTEGNATNLKGMKLEGLTISVASELPVLKEKDVWLADVLGMDPQDKHLIIFNFTVYSPYVNTSIIKPGEEPTVWKDLLDPKWKGKMVLTDYTTSAGPYQLFVPLLREKVIDEEFLKALYKQDLRFASALPDEAGLLSRGERPLSIRGSNNTYSRFITEGAPIKAVELKDGLVLSVITMAAFNGGPHPNAAKVFMNWFLSPGGQGAYSKAASTSTARKDVPTSLPKAAQISPQRPILLTNEYTDEATNLFRDRWLGKLWGR